MKKYLYCRKCKKYPDEIIERYGQRERLEEIRKWDGNCYELIKSNLDSLEFKEYCYYCNSKLICDD